MKLTELKQLLWDADPAAVLVPPRVLERVIQQVWKLPALILRTPHSTGFVVDRHVLFRHVEQEELELDPEHLLPPTVILLARPTAEELSKMQRERALLEFWRRLFHANVHLVLENRYPQPGGVAGAADTAARPKPELRDRIEAIGQDEFEEIRRVLVQDEHLPPYPDERAVYIEFASMYLELRYFAVTLLPTVFPGIRDFQKIDELLTQDVDAAGLFSRTRLQGAPDPVVKTDKSSDESYDYYWKLMASAERESASGNPVRAAILKTGAARVAPAERTQQTRESALEDMRRLTARLEKALELSPEEAAAWMQHLPALLDKADQGTRPVEASLLFDLQKACLDHERNIYSLDLVEWAVSAGRRPIKRPLPSQRWVRLNRHLRSACQRLTSARLSDADRLQLGQLLQSAQQRHEERLRGRFRPILRDAFLDVGLRPQNPTESVSFEKILEELLDRITTNGFLTFSDLRDAISRNQLKLADLADPHEFIRGDPLLRLDRRLGALLDGVYRPAEIYMTWLEKLTALNFGTATGRFLTWFVTIPFGGAFVLLEFARVLFGFFDDDKDLSRIMNLVLLAVIGFFLMAVIHVERVRRNSLKAMRALVRGTRRALIDLPLQMLPIEGIKLLVSTWTFQLVSWYLLTPLLVCVLIWLVRPEPFETPFGAVSVFLAASFLINSRMSQGLATIILQSLVAFYEELRAGLIPTLFHMLVRVFRQVLDTVESVLHTVDEWLRFRTGDSNFSLVLRTILGVLWYPIAYVARFYMVVLIEPGINPIKFPISSLAYKFMLPFQVLWTEWCTEQLRHVFGEVLALGIAASTIWLLPDAFGFLFWEIRENWSVYRANRRGSLRPVTIGPHGETARGLLHPGFHSGTVPKLYAHLREAERQAQLTGNWRDARKNRHALKEVQKSLHMFLAYELISLLHETELWKDRPLAVGPVRLSTNRIQFEVLHRELTETPFVFEVVERAGWLIGGIRKRGWVEQVSPAQQCALNTALAGLYALAGVDIVQEQIRANLPEGTQSYDLDAQGLILWHDGVALSYDLHAPEDHLTPRNPSGEPVAGPTLDARRLVFGRNPLPWSQWIENWTSAPNAAMPPLVIAGHEVNVLGIAWAARDEAGSATPLPAAHDLLIQLANGTAERPDSEPAQTGELVNGEHVAMTSPDEPMKTEGEQVAMTPADEAAKTDTPE